MAKDRSIQVQFPLGGLHKRFSYQGQPPYTTVDCLNVRPRDTLDGRLRGGSRPGLTSVLDGDDLPGPVYGLIATQQFNTSKYTQWVDDFAGDELGPQWSKLDWNNSDATFDFPRIVSGSVYTVGTTERFGAALTSFENLDADEPHSIEMLVDLSNGYTDLEFELLARLDDDEPVWPFATHTGSYGILANIALSANGSGDLVCSANLYLIVNGAASSTASGSETFAIGGVPSEAWFSLQIQEQAGTAGATLQFNDKKLAEITNVSTANTGNRFGFTILTNDSVPAAASAIRVNYNRLGSTSAPSRLAAISEGVLYEDDMLSRDLRTGSVTFDPSAMRFEEDQRVRMQQRYGRVYIADYDDPAVEGTNGKLIGFGAGATQPGLLVLRNEDNTSYDWVSAGADTDQHVVEVTDAQGTAPSGQFTIAAISSAGGIGNTIRFPTDEIQSDDDEEAACSYSIRRPPKYWDLIENKVRRWKADPGKGTIPLGCPLIALYRDRLVLAGNPKHVWYMSRQGDPNDWDYFADATDPGRALFGLIESAGTPGDEITALIPGSDDYLIIGGRDSLWIMRGDPAQGGQLDAIERSNGIYGPESWCYGSKGEIYYLSRDGLYMLPPGGTALPQAISRDKIPTELLTAADTFDWDQGPMLEYDAAHRGIHIFYPTNTSGLDSDDSTGHFWVDLDSYGFWPMTLNKGLAPFATCRAPELPSSAITGDTERSIVLFGGRDGAIRVFDEGSPPSEQSHVVFGPFMLGDGGEVSGLIKHFIATLDANSSAITYEVYVGDTPESALASTAIASGPLSGGRSHDQRVRARGTCAFVKLIGEPADKWAFENMALRLRQTGKHRLMGV